MKHIFPIILFSITLLIACSPNNNISIQKIDTPCKEGGESNLWVNQSNEAYLSWVEYLNDSTDALMMSKFINNEWKNPTQIASGSDWFVNWADFPSLVNYDNSSHLAAHWLQKSAGGTYDYDIHISQSSDQGETWSSSFIIHRDSIAAEHGFVSMFPLDSERIFATWLDGRNTKNGHDESHGHDDHGHDNGAMTLRAAEFNVNGRISNEIELDSRVCDCCQTTAILSDKGPIVAYRDRSEREVRDIAIVRKVDGKWTDPVLVAEDHWKIAGCPVNGPSISAEGEHIAVTWFTMMNEKPIVNVAFSSDSGVSFGEAIRVDEGNPLGRTDIIHIDEENVLITWMEDKESHAEIRMIKMNPNGKQGDSILVSQTDSARKSGFPILKKYKNNQALISWTRVDSLTSISSAIVNF